MPELVIFRGLPGCGKTFRARAVQRAEGGWLVGRDHLRDLLFGPPGYRPTNAKEMRVTQVQQSLIRHGLRSDSNVLVDDLNLRNQYVKRLMEMAGGEGADVRIIDLTHVDPDVCKENDRKRERMVGAALIDDFYERFIRGKPYPLPVPRIAPDVRVVTEPCPRPMS